MPGRRGLFVAKARADSTLHRFSSPLMIVGLVLIAVATGCTVIRSGPLDVTATLAPEPTGPSTARSNPADTPTLRPNATVSTRSEATPPSTGAVMPESPASSTPIPAGQFESFDAITIQSDFEVDGQGQNVDSIAFWESPDPTGTLMFVTAKANQLVEVWRYPFQDQEQPSISGVFGSGQVNGIVMDQESALL
jgi:hypothetical protein